MVVGSNGGSQSSRQQYKTGPPPPQQQLSGKAEGGFAELQAKLDELNSNIKKRSVGGTAGAVMAAGRLKGSGSGRLALPVSEPKRASSRGGSLQWVGTKSYLADRRGH